MSRGGRQPAVYIGPEESYVGVENAAEVLRRSVERGGDRVVGAPEEAEAVAFTGSSPSALPAVTEESVRFVQLPSAGIEGYLSAGVLDEMGGGRVFASAAGAYAGTVAEHALALLLACARGLPECARAERWGAQGTRRGRELSGSEVVVLGAGGIGSVLIRMLGPFGARVTAVTRSGREVDDADESLPAEDAAGLWPRGDFFVLCTPATGATRHLVGEGELAAMREGACVVNVVRGSLLDTDALVRALSDGTIGGAALDVTDPEPLPDGHPLWSTPGALITPHVANPPAAQMGNLADRVEENVRRLADGKPPLGAVDVAAGY